MSTTDSEQLVGATIGGARINSVLHEGSFAYVLSATADDGAEKVVRIAKSDVTSTAPMRRLSSFPTQSFSLKDGGASSTAVAPRLVVQKQIETLERLSMLLPETPIQFGFKGELPYYVMDKFDGQTLRELIDLGSFPLDVFLFDLFKGIMNAMSRLDGEAHGNLKPEHILVTKPALHLLSPGYFGASPTITTPEYYPALEPDDMLAVGICLFEAVCKVHPFAVRYDTATETLIAPAFRDEIQRSVDAGFVAQGGIYNFRPANILDPDITSEASEFLTKALRLGFDQDGYLVRSQGFASWDEFSEALEVFN